MKMAEIKHHSDLSPLSERASRLHLSSLSLAQGMREGVFRSLYRGQGMEFNGVREYLRGDDVRSIDWNVTARMNKPFVKVFDEERELDVFIVLDTSLSMRMGTGRVTRIQKAFDCAALVSLASLHNGSPVGAVVFDGAINFSCAPKHGRKQTMFLLSRFEKSIEQEATGGSALDSALLGALKLLKKRTLVMIFSDFRTAGYEDVLGRLCSKHDVIAARIGDPSDSVLPSLGTIPFADVESSFSRLLPTSSPSFKNAWFSAANRHVEFWKRSCIRHGAVPLILDTKKNSFAELQAFFTAREYR